MISRPRILDSSHQDLAGRNAFFAMSFPCPHDLAPRDAHDRAGRRAEAHAVRFRALSFLVTGHVGGGGRHPETQQTRGFVRVVGGKPSRGRGRRCRSVTAWRTPPVRRLRAALPRPFVRVQTVRKKSQYGIHGSRPGFPGANQKRV